VSSVRTWVGGVKLGRRPATGQPSFAFHRDKK
jgi:hypothetical protein